MICWTEQEQNQKIDIDKLRKINLIYLYHQWVRPDHQIHNMDLHVRVD